MPELLKNRYNYESLYDLAIRIRAVYDLFQVNNFITNTMNENWENLGLKARMRQIAINLGKFLPFSYEKSIAIIDKVIAGYPAEFNDFTLMYFPDFVEVYGQNEDDWDLSIAALERYTPYSSSEFAVRPFIIKNETRMMKQIAIWSKHKNEHIRRLASEGCRPQLPWGQALNNFKKNPLPVLNILDQLKTDSSLYVRKSVANNLNDISKTHPDLVAKIARDWYGKNKNTDWIVKHGCRMLLKKANKDVLNIFGFINDEFINISGFRLDNESIFIGENIIFLFEIETKKPTKIRLEYVIDYVKAKGKRSQKIFQISEIFLKPQEKKSYQKKHSFADMSTRKHYAGSHSVRLIVNGVQLGKLNFEVLIGKK